MNPTNPTAVSQPSDPQEAKRLAQKIAAMYEEEI
jgi:hypothetical protein